MRLYRVDLTKKRLAAMPEAERTLLLLLGHASNEINVLSKLILMARKDDRAILPLVDHVEAGQIFVLMRLLIGKLHEAWELFKKRMQADSQLASKYLSKLPPEADAALKKLNKHFGKKSPLTDIRNEISFHYRDDNNLVEANFQKLPEGEPWEFYLTEITGNSFYYASELVIAGSVIGLANQKAGNPSSADLSAEAHAFGKLCNTIIMVSNQITKLFGECIAEIVDTSLGDVEAEPIEIGKVPKISALNLPFFCDYDSLLPQKKTNAAAKAKRPSKRATTRK